MKKYVENLSDLKNFGPKSTEWLNAIGVYTKADLRRLGSVTIYRLLKEQGYNVSLNLVYAIEGALMDVHWNKLPPDVKAELKEMVKRLG